jgi:sulfatase modifying factor 1
MRGGCWLGPARYAQCDSSGSWKAGTRYSGLGFRLARTVPAEEPPTSPAVAPPSTSASPPASRDPDVPAWAKVAPEQIEAARAADVPVAFENSLGMRFVLVPSGTFSMGTPETEWGGREGPPHDVTISQPYYVGVTEVTNGEFGAWSPEMGTRGPHAGTRVTPIEQRDRPVSYVPWYAARDFAIWLGRQDPGHVYRLPTAAEWEYACRAGTGGRWYWGDDEAAMGRYENGPDRTLRASETNRWVSALAEDRYFATDDGHADVAPVATYLPNPWGLHDMLGNVPEWCSEDRTPPARIGPGCVAPMPEPERACRGGWCTCFREDLRAAARFSAPAAAPGYPVGFRLVAPIRAK